MNDYNELIERCKEILEWKKTGLLNGDALREYANRQPYGSEYNKLAIAEAVTLKDAAEAFVELAARVAELKARLSEVVADLEMRSYLKRGEEYGLVDVSNGVYMRAKEALGQLDGEKKRTTTNGKLTATSLREN